MMLTRDTIFRPIVLSLLLIRAVVLPVSADNQPPIFSSYSGYISVGEELTTAITTLSYDASRGITGKYAVQDENEILLGLLSECSKEIDYVYSCTWMDKYGTGTFRFLFSSDYSQFEGYWGEDDQAIYPWNGVRNGGGVLNEQTVDNIPAQVTL